MCWREASSLVVEPGRHSQRGMGCRFVSQAKLLQRDSTSEAADATRRDGRGRQLRGVEQYHKAPRWLAAAMQHQEIASALRKCPAPVRGTGGSDLEWPYPPAGRLKSVRSAGGLPSSSAAGENSKFA